MNDSARRKQLEQELEKVDREYKAAMREQQAAQNERDRVITVPDPVKDFETPEGSDYDAMLGASKRQKKWDAEVNRLRAEYQRLRKELDRYQ